MANTPVDLTDTTNPEDQGSQGTPPPPPAATAAPRGRSRSRRTPAQPQPQSGVSSDMESLPGLLEQALQQLKEAQQQQQRSEQQQQQTQQLLDRSEQREQALREQVQQAQQAQQETQERLERVELALIERLDLQPQVQREQKPPPPTAADLLWETLLEGGVGEGGDHRRSWDALGQPNSHNFVGKMTTWEDPVALGRYIKNFGFWLSTFYRGKIDDKERPTFKVAIEKVLTPAVAQQFIDHLPGGPLKSTTLPSALEVLQKQVSKKGLKLTAEMSLKEMFSRIDREWGAVHSKWYVQAYEECMLCAQGEDELLIDYIQRVESMSLKTQSSKNDMYQHNMRGLKEQAALKKGLNSVMKKMVDSRIELLEREHKYDGEYNRMLCNTDDMEDDDQVDGTTCPHACENAKCCFKPFRDLERLYYDTKVPVEHLQGRIKGSSRESQGVQGQPKGALKKHSSAKEFRNYVHVHNVEIRTALQGMSLKGDGRAGTRWTFEKRAMSVDQVQQHLVKLFGNGDTHKEGPKFIPDEKELIAIKNMLSPAVGVCFTCFSKDHQKAQCPHAVAEGVDPKPKSWADFERLRWEAKKDNKGKQNNRSGRNKGSRSN